MEKIFVIRENVFVILEKMEEIAKVLVILDKIIVVIPVMDPVERNKQRYARSLCPQRKATK